MRLRVARCPPRGRRTGNDPLDRIVHALYLARISRRELSMTTDTIDLFAPAAGSVANRRTPGR
jgi:hypothetical protein